MNEWTDIAVSWTARASLILYAASLMVRGLSAGHPARLSVARWLWTAGYGAFLAHLAAAFHFVHHWSHAAAYEETARRTFDTLGIRVGVGIYANHLFALVWGIDAVWWWVNPVSYSRRARWIEILIQGYMAFIAFNSTAVFGQGVVRWAGSFGAILIAAVWMGRWRR